MSLLANAWYKESKWIRILKPLSAVFGLISAMRKRWYQNPERNYTSSYPVIVVGNLTAGGTGKTPLVIFLAQQLREQGYKPGIVSRGYGSKAPSYPFAVNPDTSYLEAGEESLMISRHTQCPVIIDPDRVSAVQFLEAHYHCDIIISDDGMQHYRLARTIEIAVVDGQRGFGNGFLLPAGPLREKPERLQTVDMIVCNGESPHKLPEGTWRMDLDATHLVHLADNKYLSVKDEILQKMTAKKVHAVAGIGNPERFFNSLCACGFDIITHIFRDHHSFASADIQFDDDLDVVMTEKDAVKCNEFASDKHWYLKVVARLPENFMQRIVDLVAEKKH
jgi:tetraacyldisaccharide 4'-kinase